jgi:outer membrane protein OmpA-like peptidoglycan-associated protein
MRAAPPGFAAAIGAEPRGTREREIPRDMVGESVPVREPAKHGSSSGWMWPAIATLAVLALVWGVRRAHREPRVDTTAIAGGEVATPTTPSVAPLAQPGSITLPNGSTMNLPAGGVEARLVGFITDTTRQTSDTTFFDFDRLMFGTNSPRLLPQSDDQVGNVAKILAAYPNVAVRIAGYTDNVGSPAANLRLSAQRAAAVKLALIKAGVASGRISSEGFGEKNPEADNSTDAGRAQNRRVAIIVTKK